MDVERLLARAREVRTETVDADGIEITVREPTHAVHQRYAVLWSGGKDVEAIRHLLRHCVVDASGAPCLNDEQAAVLASADSSLLRPVVNKIMEMMVAQKKPDAPATDAVPDQSVVGASAI